MKFQIVSRGDARRKVWQVLIWWNQTPREEATWEDYDEIKMRYPQFHLEDKVLLQERGNVEDLSRLRHNLAAKRSRERKKRAKEGGQASTSELTENILSHEKQVGTQDSDDMANGDDMAKMLTWQRC